MVIHALSLWLHCSVSMYYQCVFTILLYSMWLDIYSVCLLYYVVFCVIKYVLSVCLRCFVVFFEVINVLLVFLHYFVVFCGYKCIFRVSLSDLFVICEVRCFFALLFCILLCFTYTNNVFSQFFGNLCGCACNMNDVYTVFVHVDNYSMSFYLITTHHVISYSLTKSYIHKSSRFDSS